MSDKYCLHCELNKFLDEAVKKNGGHKEDHSTQRWVLAALAAVVSDKIMEVEPNFRLIATANFFTQTMVYVESEAQEEVAPPGEGDHIH